MTTLVFRLRHVPEDEAAEVSALLDEAGIAWYETTAGAFGIAMPGIWVDDADDAHRARTLIDAYQHDRAARMVAARGSVSLLDRLRERPLTSIAILSFCAFVIFVMVNPFARLVTASAS